MTSLLQLPEPPNKDEIWTVSPSQLDTWFKCRFQWNLTYRGGWVAGGQNKHMKRGTMVHKLMEKLYGHYLGKPITPVDPELPWRWYEEVQKENNWFSMEDQTMLTWAFTSFIRYLGFAEREDDFVPLAIEQELFVPTGLVYHDKEVYLHGIVDLLFDLAGEFGFTDHKSHNKENGAWTFDMAYFDHQITFYSLMLYMLGYHAKIVFINSVNTFEYKDMNAQPDTKLFNRVPAPHTVRQLLQYQAELYETIEEMNTSKVYAKRRNKDCQYCGYREVCDMILRGRDPLPLLQMKHTKDQKPLTIEDPFDED